jgi:hypothetical protein
MTDLVRWLSYRLRLSLPVSEHAHRSIQSRSEFISVLFKGRRFRAPPSFLSRTTFEPKSAHIRSQPCRSSSLPTSCLPTSFLPTSLLHPHTYRRPLSLPHLPCLASHLPPLPYEFAFSLMPPSLLLPLSPSFSLFPSHTFSSHIFIPDLDSCRSSSRPVPSSFSILNPSSYSFLLPSLSLPVSFCGLAFLPSPTLSFPINRMTLTPTADTWTKKQATDRLPPQNLATIRDRTRLLRLVQRFDPAAGSVLEENDFLYGS